MCFFAKNAIIRTKEVVFLLSDNIRNYRKANNMSQDELAEKLEVTRQSISLWETGQTQPSLDNIVALAKLFNVSTDALLTNDMKMGSEPIVSTPVSKKDKSKKKYIFIIATSAVVLALAVTTLILWLCGVFSSDDDLTIPADNADVTLVTNNQFTNNVNSVTHQPANKTVSKDDLYGYLKDFVVTNGVLSGDYCYYSKSADNYGGLPEEKFSLYYWGDTDTVEFCLHSVVDDTFSYNVYLLVPESGNTQYEYISSFYYRDDGTPLIQAEGTIDAGAFTNNYPLTTTEYTGSNDEQDNFMEVSRQRMCDLLECLENFIVVEKLDYSFEEFGFVKF